MNMILVKALGALVPAFLVVCWFDCLVVQSENYLLHPAGCGCWRPCGDDSYACLRSATFAALDGLGT